MALKTFLTTTPTLLKYKWSTTGNWNPSGSPTDGDDVTMASGGGNQATYTALDDILNLTLNNMTIADNGVTLEVGAGNSLTASTLSNAGQINVFGTFTVQNINSNAGSITAGSGGQIFLTNVPTGNYFVQTGGQITISASGNLNNDPTFFIQGGLLQGLNNTAGLATADFSGSAAGHLAINTTLNANPYNNAVLHMGLGDTIEFNDVNITSLNFNSGTSTLTLNWTANGGGSRDVHITSFDVANPGFQIVTDTLTGQQAAEVTCFLRGTRIRTPAGSKPVEMLLIGDKVLTADGQTRAVRWLWRQTVVSRFADELRAYPIRIMAGALDENVPQCDLFLSPDHAILLDGCLVHAGALVNNSTIVRVTRPEPRFVYYHVELEDHSLILAEGVAAETFVDNVTRRNFDNYADYEAFYGADEVMIVEMEVPRAKSARQLPRVVRERLAARLVALSAGMREAA